MAQYCDSDQLEQNWFYWLVAAAVPALEPYRVQGLLWTKIPTTLVDDTPVVDPLTPIRHHCVVLGSPHYITSHDGRLEEFATVCVDGQWRAQELPNPATLGVACDDAVYRLELPFLQQGVLVPALRRSSYFQEPPASHSWEALTTDIGLICNGVARKFNPPNDEERANLAHDALSQVLRKLADHKLKYTPGRAPVFNLITTTVYRCLFSTMNRESRQRKSSAKLRDDLRSGAIPRSMRSLRVPGPPIRAH